VALVAIRDVLDRASVREPREKPVDVITLDMVGAEIARLEAEIGANGGTLPPYPCGCPDCQPG
jgi:hypothetical protein